MGIPRTLEPEVMDTPTEALAYDQMDHAAVNERFVEDVLTFFEPEEDEILDMGAGTARIPIALCRRAADVRVVASDLAIAMLDIARINVEIAGLIDRILLIHADAKRLELPDDRFAMVISNSLIHHLPDPVVALREAIRVTSPSGGLFFRDLLRPSSAAELDQLIGQYAGAESEAAQQMFRASLHAALTLEEIRCLVDELGFQPATVQPTSDRHWTWAARMADRSST